MKELYFADQSRYDNGMEYERCGRSGVLLTVDRPLSEGYSRRQSYGKGKVPEEFDADTRTLRETEAL